MPLARAKSATRSVIRPCARNHGAITRRVAPRRRSRCAAIASDGRGPVANAVIAPAQRVPAANVGATPAVRAFTASQDEPTATTITPSRIVVGTRRPRPDVRARPQQPGVLAEHVGLPTHAPRLADHRRDVDVRVIGAGQQQRRHDGVRGQSSQHVPQVRRGLLAERGPDVQARPQPRICSATACVVAAARGSALPCASAPAWAERTSGDGITRRATRIPSWTGPANDRCADRRPRPAWPCRARSRSTDSPRGQGD